MVSLVPVVTWLAAIVAAFPASGAAQPIGVIRREPEIVLPGAAAGQKLDLAAAMRTLHAGAVGRMSRRSYRATFWMVAISVSLLCLLQ